MNSFEKDYYEADRFWEGDNLLDEHNLNRFNETIQLIPNDVMSLADIGCGNGIFVNFLAEKKPSMSIIGIDRSEAALKFVKTNKQLGDINSLALPDNAYDCITCLEVIEHLPLNAYENALSELCRVSSKYIIISTPYDEVLKENFTQCPACKSNFNADLHLRSFDKSKINHLLQKKGFSCVSIKTLGETASFKGHYNFKKIFYPEQFKNWRSPICPICGYVESVEESGKAVKPEAKPKRRTFISYFSFLPKLLWPKNKKPYWIIALYKKEA